MLRLLTGNQWKRPLFFLGSLWRKDLYAVGGNDEDFVEPGYDDDWFGDCLIKGLGLKPQFLDHVVGLHLDHPRPANIDQRMGISKKVYYQKRTAALDGTGFWEAREGSWNYVSD